MEWPSSSSSSATRGRRLGRRQSRRLTCTASRPAVLLENHSHPRRSRREHLLRQPGRLLRERGLGIVDGKDTPSDSKDQYSQSASTPTLLRSF